MGQRLLTSCVTRHMGIQCTSLLSQFSHTQASLGMCNNWSEIALNIGVDLLSGCLLYLLFQTILLSRFISTCYHWCSKGEAATVEMYCKPSEDVSELNITSLSLQLFCPNLITLPYPTRRAVKLLGVQVLCISCKRLLWRSVTKISSY